MGGKNQVVALEVEDNEADSENSSIQFSFQQRKKPQNLRLLPKARFRLTRKIVARYRVKGEEAK